MSNNGNWSSGTTYQTVIIGLIAGAILTTGVMSIIWKRRNQRQWLELRRSLNSPGMRGGLGGGAGKDERKIGREPKLWDILIGSRPELGTDPDAERDDVSLGEDTLEEKGGAKTQMGVMPKKPDAGYSTEARGISAGQSTRVVDLLGNAMGGWKPASISLVHNAPPGGPPAEPTPFGLQPQTSRTTSSDQPSAPDKYGTYEAGMTVLIAMPTRPASGTRLDGLPTPESSSSTSRSLTQNRYQDSYEPPDYPDLYHHVPQPIDRDSFMDEEPLPALVIGSTSIAVQQPTGNERRELDKYLKEAQAEGGNSVGRGNGEAVSVDDPSRQPGQGQLSFGATYGLLRMGGYVPSGVHLYSSRVTVGQGRGRQAGES